MISQNRRLGIIFSSSGSFHKAITADSPFKTTRIFVAGGNTDAVTVIQCRHAPIMLEGSLFEKREIPENTGSRSGCLATGIMAKTGESPYLRHMIRKYPIGLQSFLKIRKGDYIYIDKTEIIYQLVETGQYYFLSRPRRFGKSLLVDTIEQLFSGKKELFEGLWIHDQ